MRRSQRAILDELLESCSTDAVSHTDLVNVMTHLAAPFHEKQHPIYGKNNTRTSRPELILLRLARLGRAQSNAGRCEPAERASDCHWMKASPLPSHRPCNVLVIFSREIRMFWCVTAFRPWHAANSLPPCARRARLAPQAPVPLDVIQKLYVRVLKFNFCLHKLVSTYLLV